MKEIIRYNASAAEYIASIKVLLANHPDSIPYETLQTVYGLLYPYMGQPEKK